MDLDSKKLLGLLSIGCAGIFILKSLIYNLLYQKPTSVAKLIIYPIKALHGIEVDRLEILESGVKYESIRDRCFALINDNHRLVTQSTKPKLALIRLRLDGDVMVLNATDMPTLRIANDCHVTENPLVDFTIWGEPAEGYVCHHEINEWFSRYLDIPVRMVKFIDGLKQTKSKIPGTNIDADTTAFFQNFFPIMLINQSSVDDLNKRIKQEQDRVSYRNFRPNILVEGPNAYEEDQWRRINISGVIMKMPRLCDRCIFTTVHPDRGEKSSNNEPLRTLRNYRMKPELSNDPIMGIYLAPLTLGHINVGDSVIILDYEVANYE